MEFLLIYFVCRFVHKSLRSENIEPQWEKRLKLASYIAMGLFVASIVSYKYTIVFVIMGQLAIIGLIYLLYTQPVFKKVKSIYLAIAPYIIVSIIINIIKAVMPSFYKEWDDFLEMIQVFTIIWGVGVWIVTVRQKKELDKAKAKVAEEERNNKIMSSMKAELEIQVAERTAALTRQKEELEVALNELKATQAQLIQSEKMASLGELTAGIAHEIQNPLNFVNNFSEVSKELLDEMKTELDNGNTGEAKELADNVIQNLEKINHHGKRADGIVKGMLQHSRTSSGQKELTDINALADEYLRLSYHGLRAKDKTFNARFETNFDTSVSKINVVPQDIGRVILNLINNAFYAVSEKKKHLQPVAGEGSPVHFEPTVQVITKNLGDKIEVVIKDNGNGIPQKIIDKIFQPFFTTKPTGQGTGLGLSLSYDIITKGHGGELKVETTENEGTAFIITLPVTTAPVIPGS